MKCSVCGNETRTGIVKSQVAGSLLDSRAMLLWYSDEDKSKIIQKNSISLWIKGSGYYCEECMKVFAVFEQR